MATSSPVENGSAKRKACEKEEKQKRPCKYGKECYRRNPYHLLEFSHPDDTDNCPEKKQKIQCESPKKQKIKCESPKKQKNQCGTSSSGNQFLFSTVKGIDDVYNDCNIAVDLKSILADNCDKLEASVQFNYMFEVPWLVQQYSQSVRDKPLLLVHGFTGAEKLGIEGEAMKYKQIDLVHAKLPIPYGTHHSKMMFLLYSNGFKVVIHTANLIEKDWFQKTQGMWISPLFTKKTSTYCEEGDVFKKDLVEYLSTYKSSKLTTWVTKINDYDMSTANVHLIASVPGRHVGEPAMSKWGHLKMRQILSNLGPDKSSVTKDWPVVGQFSSIGSLGDNSDKWLCSEWLRSLSCCKGDKFIHSSGKCDNALQLIYPTIQNVRDCLEGYSAGGSLPFSVTLAMKQRFMREYLCQWVANDVGRSLASPHIKSYTRLSPDSKLSSWFLLTSANLSKAAWGVYEKNKSQFMIRSYEIGVLFMPKKEGDRNPVFSLKSTSVIDKQVLRLPFDVPLVPYEPADKPWVWDIKYTTEDSHGRLWIPS